MGTISVLYEIVFEQFSTLLLMGVTVFVFSFLQEIKNKQINVKGNNFFIFNLFNRKCKSFYFNVLALHISHSRYTKNHLMFLRIQLNPTGHLKKVEIHLSVKDQL